jgi:hypothetical protein
MAKFDIGTWVKKDGKRGIVTGLRDRSTLVRWVGKSKAALCGTRSVIECDPPRALVLEGSLDHWLHSTRSEGDLLRTWLRAIGVRLAYKNIHTLEDIRVIGNAIGKNRPLFVHISCHGYHDDAGRAYIRLAPGTGSKHNLHLNSNKTIRIFREVFQGMPVLFSACNLGKYQKEMKQFLHASRLSYIAAFTTDIYDADAMLFELLLYHNVLNNGWTFETSVEKAKEALARVNVKGDQGKSQSLVRLFKPSG